MNLEGGLPHERTTLAWERTAIASIIAGAAGARYASQETHLVFAAIGVAEIILGAALLMWANRNDRLLHDLSLPASSVPQFQLTRMIGLGTAVFTGLVLVLAVVATVAGRI